MSDPQSFGVTECPTCKKLVITVDSEELPAWQYLCVGTPEVPCRTAFEFKLKDDKPEE